MGNQILTQARKAKIQQEFADWLVLTPTQRTRLGMPQNVRAFARRYEVGERTLRRWMAEDQRFNDLVQERTQQVKEASLAGVASPEPDKPVDAVPLSQLLATDSAPADMLEGTFNYSWAKLQELIANGDKAALQMYLNSPLARSVMDAMVEQQKSDFADLTDGELLERLFASVSDDELVAEMTRRGLSC